MYLWNSILQFIRIEEAKRAHFLSKAVSADVERGQCVSSLERLRIYPAILRLLGL